jgi:hypothetical protein
LRALPAAGAALRIEEPLDVLRAELLGQRLKQRLVLEDGPPRGRFVDIAVGERREVGRAA